MVPGDTVTQGQLLISGAVDLDNGGLRWQHGMGRVWARTWYELTAQVPLDGAAEGSAPVLPDPVCPGYRQKADKIIRKG